MTDLKNNKAYIITGPTSGIGRLTAFELAKFGTVVLVGRNRKKLDESQRVIEQSGQHAVSVQCDLSDIASVRRAAEEIIALKFPIAGLLNNAGIMQMRTTKNAQGWDTTFATNHLGPFALTEALIPHLPDGANVVFVVSGVEDPKRRFSKVAGYRGGRFVSVEASVRGEWTPGGSKIPGLNAYATSKQCILAAAMALSRETPRLRINAIEPGFVPNTGLARDTNAILRFIANYLLPLLAPHIKNWSTPLRAACLETEVLTDESGKTGIYYNEKGHAMLGSTLVQDPKFQDLIISETRAFLLKVQ